MRGLGRSRMLGPKIRSDLFLLCLRSGEGRHTRQRSGEMSCCSGAATLVVQVASYLKLRRLDRQDKATLARLLNTLASISRHENPDRRKTSSAGARPWLVGPAKHPISRLSSPSALGNLVALFICEFHALSFGFDEIVRSFFGTVLPGTAARRRHGQHGAKPPDLFAIRRVQYCAKVA
jgi:hypothetical protein